jgi:putative ABC transport system ATP-binding protein
MSDHVIEARDLVKIYGDGDAAVRALDGVSVAFARGEFAAIMGASGSGKSTLLHCLAGLDRPTSGSVTCGGLDLAVASEGELTRLRRDRIGFVFQAFNLLPTLTAAENILLPLDLAGRRVEPEWFDGIVGVAGDRGAARPPALRTVGWAAAARRHRPGPDHPPGGGVRRRTHRRAGFRHRVGAAGVPA